MLQLRCVSNHALPRSDSNCAAGFAVFITAYAAASAFVACWVPTQSFIYASFIQATTMRIGAWAISPSCGLDHKATLCSPHGSPRSWPVCRNKFSSSQWPASRVGRHNCGCCVDDPLNLPHCQTSCIRQDLKFWPWSLCSSCSTPKRQKFVTSTSATI
jgi:hypothetical protein